MQDFIDTCDSHTGLEYVHVGLNSEKMQITYMHRETCFDQSHMKMHLLYLKKRHTFCVLSMSSPRIPQIQHWNF